VFTRHFNAAMRHHKQVALAPKRMGVRERRISTSSYSSARGATRPPHPSANWRRRNGRGSRGHAYHASASTAKVSPKASPKCAPHVA